jgi:hypothetical protein
MRIARPPEGEPTRIHENAFALVMSIMQKARDARAEFDARGHEPSESSPTSGSGAHVSRLLDELLKEILQRVSSKSWCFKVILSKRRDPGRDRVVPLAEKAEDGKSASNQP